jgi:peptide deformylase
MAAQDDADAPAEELDEKFAPAEELDEELASAELDPETRARRDAALRYIRKLGDPVLRASAVAVDRFDEDLRREIEQMGELMHDALGIGLAANQVGVLHRVLVYRTDPEDDITALVNPVLEWHSEELEAAEEGCLSLPGVRIEVERPARVRVRARDALGEELTVEAEGLEARVIQHEIDHLDGVLILDRVTRTVRKEAMRALREALQGEAQAADPHAARTVSTAVDGTPSRAGGGDGEAASEADTQREVPVA